MTDAKKKTPAADALSAFCDKHGVTGFRPRGHGAIEVRPRVPGGRVVSGRLAIAPGYYGAVAFDVETTLACEACPEGNPLIPDTKNRAVLYGHAALWAVAFTIAAERTRHARAIYAVATMMRLVVGVLNLRYAGRGGPNDREE